MEINVENATETAINGGGQAGTTHLRASVMVLSIAAVLQLIVVAFRNVLAPSHFAMFCLPLHY